MRMRHKSAWLALATLVGACGSSQIPDPEPWVPQIPTIESAICVAPPTIEIQPSDLARTTQGTAACVTEYLDDDGCVAGRVRRTFDAAKRVIREELLVLGDSKFLPSPGPYVSEPTRSKVTTFAYDARGNRTETTIDDLADGTVDLRVAWQWDEAGRQIEELRIWTGPDGAPIERRIWRTYNDAGELLEERTSQTGEAERLERREYDAAGRRRSVLIWAGEELQSERVWEYDSAGELTYHLSAWGNRREETRYDFDARGLLVHKSWVRSISGVAGVRERHDYLYWETGTLQRETYTQDSPSTGRTSSRRIIHYDTAGREIFLEDDDGADGRIDWTREQGYDSAGRQIFRRVRVGGSLRSEATWAYDDSGRLVRRTSFSASAYTVGSHRIETFQYGDAGNLSRVDLLDSAGRLISRQEQQYDASGNRVLSRIDSDGDGRFDRVTRDTYDSAGQRIRSELDADGDGRADQITRDRYDAAGRHVWSELDLDADGQLDRSSTWLFDAAGNLLFSAEGATEAQPGRRTLSSYGCF